MKRFYLIALLFLLVGCIHAQPGVLKTRKLQADTTQVGLVQADSGKFTSRLLLGAPITPLGSFNGIYLNAPPGKQAFGGDYFGDGGFFDLFTGNTVTGAGSIFLVGARRVSIIDPRNAGSGYQFNIDSTHGIISMNNLASTSRQYYLQDKSDTVAMLSDIVRGNGTVFIFNPPLRGTKATGLSNNPDTITVRDTATAVAGFDSTRAWRVQGNSGLSSSTNFLGTTDSVDVVVKTNNQTRAKFLAGSGYQENASTASGKFSHAEGIGTTASGRGSHAEDSLTVASGSYSHAEGANDSASGNFSHVEGSSNAASGLYSHAEGLGSKARNDAAHAEGYSNTTTGINSHVEGAQNTINKEESHAEGYNNTNLSKISHIEGWGNLDTGATGNGGNHVEGANNSLTTTSVGDLANHVEGYSHSLVHVNVSHVEGQQNSSSIGTVIHVEGYSNAGAGQYTHTEGQSNTMDNNSTSSSHVEGYSNHTVTGANYSHGEGYSNYVSGQAAHVEGSTDSATGVASHAEGSNNKASGTNAHAGGRQSVASGNTSTATGDSVLAQGYGQTVIGKLNVAEGLSTYADSNYAWIIGNGINNVRHNAAAFRFNGQLDVDSNVTSRTPPPGKGTTFSKGSLGYFYRDYTGRTQRLDTTITYVDSTRASSISDSTKRVPAPVSFAADSQSVFVLGGTTRDGTPTELLTKSGGRCVIPDSTGWSFTYDGVVIDSVGTNFIAYYGTGDIRNVGGTLSFSATTPTPKDSYDNTGTHTFALDADAADHALRFKATGHTKVIRWRIVVRVIAAHM